MGILFRPRGPRSFQHVPIYWNPEKEALDKRIRGIKHQLVEDGRLLPSDENGDTDSLSLEEGESDLIPSVLDLDKEETLRESFIKGTRHLRAQEKKGIDRTARLNATIRSLVILALLIFFSWLLFFR